ncbi:MAG: hypothetical protein OSA97_03985 [Nevskia sp.]|nr:hypothetical protein [Nevskia sp.]
MRAQSQAQQEVRIEYRKGVLIHVFGGPPLDPDHLRKAVIAAASLSDALRTVGYIYYVSGYPAALLSYAETGQYLVDIYVRVVPGRVRDVTGAPELQAFFADLKGAKGPLTSSRLEADRALADGFAQRAGVQYQPRFVPAGGDAVTLDLGEAKPDQSQPHVLGTFGNYGNRYAGPYLATASIRDSFSSGDEITLAGGASARFLGLGGAHSEPYHEGDAGWSRVTPYGVFALQGRYADFSQTVQGYRFNGKLSSGSASWLYPLYSDFQQRLNLQAKFERDHESLDAPAVTANCNLLGGLLSLLGLSSCPVTVSSGGEALSELYNSAELGLNYIGRVQHGEQQAELQAGLILRKGLGPHQTTGTAASLDYFLWQPSFSVRYTVTPHWAALADGSFQFANSILPQQQMFVIGGPASAHAYEAGAGVGDHGENLRLGVERRGYDDSWTERYGLRPRGFVEYGASALAHRVVGDPNGRVTIADVGTAVDMRFTSWLGGSLSLALSIYSHGGDSSPNGLARKYVFFQLAAKY